LKEYELKTPNLRLYLFHEECKGHIVAVLAKKSKRQQIDISNFRKIKSNYLKDRNEGQKGNV